LESGPALPRCGQITPGWRPVALRHAMPPYGRDCGRVGGTARTPTRMDRVVIIRWPVGRATLVEDRRHGPAIVTHGARHEKIYQGNSLIVIEFGHLPVANVCDTPNHEVGDRKDRLANARPGGCCALQHRWLDLHRIRRSSYLEFGCKARPSRASRFRRTGSTVRGSAARRLQRPRDRCWR
jgi:hypothetical protein